MQAIALAPGSFANREMFPLVELRSGASNCVGSGKFHQSGVVPVGGT